jgi:hypothetical protein
MFIVDSAKNDEVYNTATTHGMGEDSGLAALQKYADGLKKDEIIKELNKE